MRRAMEIIIEMDIEMNVKNTGFDEAVRRSLKGKMKREFERVMLNRETIERQKREVQQHPSGEMAALAVHGEDNGQEEAFSFIKKKSKSPIERLKEKKKKREAKRSGAKPKMSAAQQAAFEKFRKKGREAQR